jgi:hypothetical protein
VPSPAWHEWAKRISEFVLGHGPKPTAKFQHNSHAKLGKSTKIMHNLDVFCLHAYSCKYRLEKFSLIPDKEQDSSESPQVKRYDLQHALRNGNPPK